MAINIDRTREIPCLSRVVSHGSKGSPSRPRHSFPGRVAAVWVLATLAVALPMAATARVVELEDGSRAVLDERLDLYLEAVPQRGQGWLSFTDMYCEGRGAVQAIQAANERRSLLVGVRYRIPFDILSAERQLQVIVGLFADDRGVPSGWKHHVGTHRSDVAESLWRVAEWFTGSGDNYRLLREANEMSDDHLEADQVVLIPAGVLRPALRRVLPEESAYDLDYDRDSQGEYAIYRLQPGEALYSSVAARFSGLVYADDVNRLAGEIAQRSGIGDVTDIPVGYSVKIPFEDLLPEFLPAGHADRRAYEESLLASGRYSNSVEAQRLQDVTIVLDAGHGGKDPGSSVQGVWESVYVYDIALRLKETLERTTAAKVFMTTQSGQGYSVQDRDRLDYVRDHRVLTNPAYPIVDSRTGVNLRWYLTNSLFRQAVRDREDPDKVVFLSVHADSLHPSLRGAMAYIPGALYRKGSYGKTGAVYASRREVQEKPRVSFSTRELERSEGLSRQLALGLMQAFERGGVAVHEDKPVRNRVVRSRRQTWVPAVLRYSEVPAQMLLEVCNLNNPEDRRLIQTRGYRQKVADLTVQGILDYYDSSDGKSARVAP